MSFDSIKQLPFATYFPNASDYGFRKKTTEVVAICGGGLTGASIAAVIWGASSANQPKTAQEQIAIYAGSCLSVMFGGTTVGLAALLSKHWKKQDESSKSRMLYLTIANTAIATLSTMAIIQPNINKPVGYEKTDQERLTQALGICGVTLTAMVEALARCVHSVTR